VITSGQWKLMEFFEDGRLELYDLQKDLGEKHNLAQQNAAKAVELQAKLSAWRKKVMAPMPTPHQAGVRPAGVDAGKKSAEDE
jgi:arylsulfatase A-like enzyme